LDQTKNEDKPRRCSLTLLSETALSLYDKEQTSESNKPKIKDSSAVDSSSSEIIAPIPTTLTPTVKSQLPSTFSTTPTTPPTRRASLNADLGVTAKNHRRHVAQHHYRDFANETMTPSDLSSKRKPKGGVTVPFPLKLHEMLDEIEKDGLASVISWQPHGRAFVVHKPLLFVEKVLPEYFKQSKFSSFQRQLNLYGFSRLSAGKDKGGYYHELFLRGKPTLSLKMVRTKVKGTGVRGGSNPDTEPNFYRMPPVRPDPINKSHQQTPLMSASQQTTHETTTNNILHAAHATHADCVQTTSPGTHTMMPSLPTHFPLTLSKKDSKDQTNNDHAHLDEKVEERSDSHDKNYQITHTT